MILDWFIFPSPDSSYTIEKTNGELIYIPKTLSTEVLNDKIQKTSVDHIPCLFLRATSISVCPKFAIFFHGNAEDIGLSFDLLT